MSQDLAEFVESFVLPLLAGGEVHVGRPLRPRDRDAMAEDAGALGDARLRFARLRRAQALVVDPDLPDPGLDELGLWTALHNALVFDHPDRRRVWARGSTWRRAEGATRTMLAMGQPEDTGDGLARHVSVGAFVRLRRVDVIVATTAGDVRYRGQDVPRRRLRLAGGPEGGHRDEHIEWLGGPHAPETERLIEDVLRASPLTCLLEPLIAPAGWSPLSCAPFLQDRQFARAVCYRWAAHRDWVAVGGSVMSALIPALSVYQSAPRSARELAVDQSAPRSARELAVDQSAPRSARELPVASSGRASTDRHSAARTDEDEASSSSSGPLALPGIILPTSPEAFAAVVGALIHLHFLKVLELEARLGVAFSSRDPGILSFLALPLLLPWLGEVMGSPLAPVSQSAHFEAQAARRWTEYLDHLGELVPRSVLENLLSSVVPRIVKSP